MNKQIIEEAAEWFVDFTTDEPDRARKQVFGEWLLRSPEHVRAYLELLPLWEDGAGQPVGASASPDELIALARGAHVVIGWGESPAATAASARSAGGRRWRRARGDRLPGIASQRLGLACAAAVLLVAGGIFWSQTLRTRSYTTGVGQQRAIQLPDGSRIELNTDSRVRVHFDHERRDVELDYGQALFQVAKDTTRPFVVASNQTRIRALGTQFDVYSRKSATTVTVLEGKVAVMSTAGADDEAVAFATPVSAGEQVTVAAAAPVRAIVPTVSAPKRANVAVVTAWAQHRLLFDSTPLPQVAAEFNRYNTRHLIIDQSTLGDYHVSGSFASTDPVSLVRFLAAQRGIKVRESADSIYVSRQ